MISFALTRHWLGVWTYPGSVDTQVDICRPWMSERCERKTRIALKPNGAGSGDRTHTTLRSGDFKEGVMWQRTSELLIRCLSFVYERYA